MSEQEFLEWVRARWDEREKTTGRMLSKDPVYLSASLMGESAEVWDVIKKPFRDGRGMNAGELVKLCLELGDAYHYLTRLLDLYGITMDEIREMNQAKLQERDRRGA